MSPYNGSDAEKVLDYYNGHYNGRIIGTYTRLPSSLFGRSEI